MCRHVSLAAIAILLATAAVAHEGVKDPQVLARMDLMKDIATAVKTLGEMAKGAREFDKTAANKAMSDISRHAGQIAPAFAEPADDPKSEARRSIWDEWDIFSAEANALDAAARSAEINVTADVRPALGRVAKACGSCHEAYRD